MHTTGFLVFDIETVALPEAAEYIEPATAPANYKDAEKIAAYCAAKDADAVSRCALDPDLCRIVSVGWMDTFAGLGSDINVFSCHDDAERSVLQEFWRRVRTVQVVGYNCIGFDLPVMLRRSMYLGVKPSLGPSDLNKYRMGKVLDLMQLLSFSGALKYRSLDFYCTRLGLDVPDEHSGKDIGALYAAGDWEAIEAHCRADVLKTALLADCMGVFS
jgi:predicted PolB exonuclease-like 3'-5' exonuclease